MSKVTNSENLARIGMTLSLVVSVVLLIVKIIAVSLTHSTAILSDATESVVHLVAVLFAAYSFRVARIPPDKSHPYGHAKISFFSSAFEGFMICLAAVYILWEATLSLVNQSAPERLTIGLILSVLVMATNLSLGIFLVKIARKSGNVVLRANGIHVLTDAWTSAGVLVALILIKFTGWILWDPIVGILIAINILVSGSKLIIKGIDGLMDRADPQVEHQLRTTLDRLTKFYNIHYHRLKFRDIGGTLDVDLDLLFPDEMPIKQAHQIATEVEKKLTDEIQGKAIVSTHLEPLDHHKDIHPESKFEVE